MKNKTLLGIIASAIVGSIVTAPSMISTQNTTHTTNKVLMVNNTNNSRTNEAVVINGNSNMNLYALSNGSGIVSYLSTGEMLTILGQEQGNYYKVRVQETGAVGYINVSNMQVIENGVNSTLTSLSEMGKVVNVSTIVRLRSNPSISNNIITDLTNGTSFTILGKQGQWFKINVNGTIGFIYETYVGNYYVNNSSTSQLNNGSIENNSGSPSQTSSKIVTKTNILNNSQVPLRVHKNELDTHNNSKKNKSLLNLTSNSEMLTNKNDPFYENPLIILEGTSLTGNINGQAINITFASNKKNNLLDGYETINNGVRIPITVTFNDNNIEYTINEYSKGNIIGVYKLKYTNGFLNLVGTYTNVANGNKTENVTLNTNMISPSTVIQENSSKISQSQLGSIMRNWLLNEQFNYSGFADCEGTVWGQPWLNVVSNSKIMEAYVQANGEQSLSENITAAKLNKAAMQLTRIVSKGPMPLTLEQAKVYLTKLAARDGYGTLTKIVQNKYGYVVYTAGAHTWYPASDPLWYVNGYTGYCNGCV